MFMSPIELDHPFQSVFPDLAGQRVLLTGLTADAGVDVVRAFAEHRCRLIIQIPDISPEMTELGAVLSETAGELEILNLPLTTGDSAIQLAQRAMKTFGGVDCVINIARLGREDMAGIAEYAEVEALVSAKLLAPTLISRVVANRMRMMMIEGSIFNVVTMPKPVNERERMLIEVLRAALAALTRSEAQEWSREGIRINAIAPKSAAGSCSSGAPLVSEPDIAALALHLASKKGRQLSGYIFDTEAHAG
jgi:3-oxoacyl-[acyl-carrier protein] reductase